MHLDGTNRLTLFSFCSRAAPGRGARARSRVARFEPAAYGSAWDKTQTCRRMLRSTGSQTTGPPRGGSSMACGRMSARATVRARPDPRRRSPEGALPASRAQEALRRQYIHPNGKLQDRPPQTGRGRMPRGRSPGGDVRRPVGQRPEYEARHGSWYARSKSCGAPWPGRTRRLQILTVKFGLCNPGIRI